MKGKSLETTWAVATFALAVSVAIGLNAQWAAAQAGAGGPQTEEVFKNIQILKGQPADRLVPTMVFFEASLGVGCPFCHDQDANKRDLDTKETKKTARRMIQMVMDINKNTFAGERRVNCFTCHQGRNRPIGMPVVAGTQLPPALGEDFDAVRPKPPAVPAVTVDQIFDKYMAALGGSNAVGNASSLVAKGVVIQRRPGREFPITQLEISSKAPGKAIMVTRVGQAENTLAYNGGNGWARAGAGPARDLRATEVDAAILEDTFNLPRQLKQSLTDLKVMPPERFEGREWYVVSGRTKSLPQVKLYFSEDSGMLTRLVYYTDSIIGQYPTRIEYSDFRAVNGAKVPYRWVISQTRNREYTYVMDTVQAASLDDSKFAKPGASAQ